MADKLRGLAVSIIAKIMAYQQRMLADFEARLCQLGDWPNNVVIYDITAFLDMNRNSARELSEYIVARIMNPAINQAFKFPLFCVLDSVMRGVPDPYISLFSHVIVDLFQYIFENVIITYTMHSHKLSFLESLKLKITITYFYFYHTLPFGMIRSDYIVQPRRPRKARSSSRLLAISNDSSRLAAS